MKEIDHRLLPILDGASRRGAGQGVYIPCRTTHARFRIRHGRLCLIVPSASPVDAR
jgi:hypothetical protein